MSLFPQPATILSRSGFGRLFEISLVAAATQPRPARQSVAGQECTGCIYGPSVARRERLAGLLACWLGLTSDLLLSQSASGQLGLGAPPPVINPACEGKRGCTLTEARR